MVSLHALVLGILVVVTQQLASAQSIPRVESGSVAGKCWIFAHMNKSGGTSVKKILKRYILKHNNVSHGIFDTDQWKWGGEYAQEYLQMGNAITWGGYTEGLRPYEAQDCKWFTMFRHPISRVVSAYYYCKKTHDQLCAEFEGRTDEDSILEFAKHWGNYGMMQLALAFLTPEDIASDMSWAADLGDNFCIETDESGQHLRWNSEARMCAGWYLFKLYVDQRSVGIAQHAEVSASEHAVVSLNQVWMHQFLQPAMDLLSQKYTAVGILEHWNPSMKLFQAALELPNMDWVADFMETRRARVNSDPQSAETLSKAWYDARIRELLWLDILLYDHAVSVFNKQVKEYNIQT